MPALDGEFRGSTDAGHYKMVNIRYQLVVLGFTRTVRRMTNSQLAKGQMRRQRHAPCAVS
jgi:hypothetical protein